MFIEESAFFEHVVYILPMSKINCSVFHPTPTQLTYLPSNWDGLPYNYTRKFGGLAVYNITTAKLKSPKFPTRIYSYVDPVPNRQYYCNSDFGLNRQI